MTAEPAHSAAATAKDHGLVAPQVWLANKGVRYEKRPVKGEDGKVTEAKYSLYRDDRGVLRVAAPGEVKGKKK